MRLSEIKAISPAGAHQKEHLTPPKSLQRGHRIQARRKTLQTSRSCNQGLWSFAALTFPAGAKQLDRWRTLQTQVQYVGFTREYGFFCSSGTGAFRLNVNYFTLLQRARSTNEQPQWAQLNRTAPFRTELEWLSNYNSISDCEFHLN